MKGASLGCFGHAADARGHVPTKETEQAGAKRLSASAARARIESGGGGVSLMKKMASRRSVTVGDLMPASGGSMAPPPERLFFAQGTEGEAQYEQAMVVYSNKHLGAKARQVCLPALHSQDWAGSGWVGRRGWRRSWCWCAKVGNWRENEYKG